MRTTFTAVPGLDVPAASRDNSLTDGQNAYVVRGGDLLAVSPRAGRLLWCTVHERPDPKFYGVPRRLRAHGRRLWAQPNVVAFVFDTPAGVRVEGHDPRTGRVQWGIDVETPPPLAWTESVPAWEGAPTEELNAFFADARELVLVVNRTSRRSMLWPDVPMPPRSSRIELHGIDAQTGAVRWSASLDGVEIPILEMSALDLLFRTPTGVADVDAATGRTTTWSSSRKERGWPKRIGGQVCEPWRGKGQIGIERWNEGSNPTTEAWSRRGTKQVTLHRLDSRAVLQVNEQYLSVLTSEFRAPWEVRVRTFVYGMDLLEGARMIVGTTGAYGGAYCFALEDGSPTAALPRKGGVWSLLGMGQGSAIAMCTQNGLEIWDPTRSASATIAHERPPALIAGRMGSGVVALCSEPTSGILLVE